MCTQGGGLGTSVSSRRGCGSRVGRGGNKSFFGNGGEGEGKIKGGGGGGGGEKGGGRGGGGGGGKVGGGGKGGRRGGEGEEEEGTV